MKQYLVGKVWSFLKLLTSYCMTHNPGPNYTISEMYVYTKQDSSQNQTSTNG